MCDQVTPCEKENIDQQIRSHTAAERQRQEARMCGKPRTSPDAASNRRGNLVPFHSLPGRLDHDWDTANLLHVGEYLSRSIRFPCLSVNTEKFRVRLHDRLECTEPRTCAKPRKHRGGIWTRGGDENIPASRPTTESFSQFDPDALTRYLKPIALEVSTRQATRG